ncbi:hypothetical protein Lal_00024234 [Lupinus albus]|nr:hypothetical protein Lal_00024234 [Lupinus albus]
MKLPFIETKGQDKAKCNHCCSTYFCDPNRHSTNSMRKHLTRKNQWIFSKVGKHGTLHGFMSKNVESDVLDGASSIGYYLDDCLRVVNEFIICNEMLFKVHSCKGLLSTLFRRKEKTKGLSCRRVCMTTDCWTSNQNLGYMCLITHFIDGDWRLQKKILNFCQVENHKGETIGKEMERCLREWGIKRLVGRITSYYWCFHSCIMPPKNVNKDMDDTMLQLFAEKLQEHKDQQDARH